jgi:hypothetical protein
VTIQGRIKIGDIPSKPASANSILKSLVKARIYFLFRGYSSVKNSARIRAALSRLHANELTEVFQVLIRKYITSAHPE